MILCSFLLDKIIGFDKNWQKKKKKKILEKGVEKMLL